MVPLSGQSVAAPSLDGSAAWSGKRAIFSHGPPRYRHRTNSTTSALRTSAVRESSACKARARSGDALFWMVTCGRHGLLSFGVQLFHLLLPEGLSRRTLTLTLSLREREGYCY